MKDYGVVKFDGEEQRRMKFLSKTVYNIAKVGKPISILIIVVIALVMLFVPLVTMNIGAEENHVEFFGQDIEYRRNNEELILINNGEEINVDAESDAELLNMAIDFLEETSMGKITLYIELFCIMGVISMVLVFNMFKHLKTLSINIHDDDTPFTEENARHIELISYFLGAIMVIGIVSNMFLGKLTDNQVGLNINFGGIFVVLLIYMVSYIFKYGYRIQLDSEGRMYDK